MSAENVMTNVDVVVPSFVNWIATDADGFVCGFEKKPEPHQSSKMWSVNGGEFSRLYLGKIPEKWENTLIKWT